LRLDRAGTGRGVVGVKAAIKQGRPDMKLRLTKPTKAVAALALVLTMVLAACSGDATDADFEEIAASMTATTASAGRAGGEAVASDSATPGDDGGAPAEAPGDTLGSGGIDSAVLQTANIGRDIIFTADLTVAVTDVAEAGAEATRIIEELGGFVFGQDTVGAPEPRSTLTFKVLPGDFQRALAALGSIGEIRTQTVTADDVTERVVDLESRISTAEASVARLKGFLEEATDIKTIAELENQLLQRETDLETMRGSLRTLRDRVDLATIYLTLTEALSDPSLAVGVTGFPGHDGGVSCPGEGRIAVDEGEVATVCFEITNTGDTPLAGFELRDTVLDVDLNDLIEVWGDPSDALEPGQSLVLAYEIVVTRNLRTQTRVAAEPVDQEGSRVEGREIASTVSMNIEASDPGGLPGFQDGLEASWSALLGIGGVLILFAGAALPLIVPVAVLLALILWFVRRGKNGNAAETAEEPQTDEPRAEEPENQPTES
jgi:uncharacterized coiled-coil protein SlyX